MSVFLHIGRGKSGSSTIQTLVQQHGALFRSEGVHCPLMPNGMANHVRLATALGDPATDRSPIRELRHHLRGTLPKLFISSEFLMNLRSGGISFLRRLLGNREVRILVYVRPYPDWLLSLYAQRTKRATSHEDFDTFFAATADRVSVLPDLERWSAAFGWQSVRVRPLSPDRLVGGRLLTDLFSALEITKPVPQFDDSNVSPHWITLELLRAIASAGGEVDMKSVQALWRLGDQCTAGIEPRRGPYLTRTQWGLLADRFAGDMRVLERHMGTALSVDLREPDERPFLPSVASIPAGAKADFLTALHHSPWSRRLQPHVRRQLEDILASPAPPAH